MKKELIETLIILLIFGVWLLVSLLTPFEQFVKIALCWIIATGTLNIWNVDCIKSWVDSTVKKEYENKI